MHYFDDKLKLWIREENGEITDIWTTFNPEVRMKPRQTEEYESQLMKELCNSRINKIIDGMKWRKT